jgi:hypothetical protein
LAEDIFSTVFDTIYKLDNAHKSQGRGPESEAREFHGRKYDFIRAESNFLILSVFFRYTGTIKDSVSVSA